MTMHEAYLVAPIYPGNVSGGPENLSVGQGNMYLGIKTDCTDPENV